MHTSYDYGLWFVVLMNVLVFGIFAFSFLRPKRRYEWRSLGVFTAFIFHVLPILVGTTVDFKNSDDVLHNVFTPFKAGDRFNLGTWGKGGIRSYTFKKPGEVVILCNVHPEMEGISWWWRRLTLR